MAPLSRFVLASRTGITGDFHNKIGQERTAAPVSEQERSRKFRRRKVPSPPMSNRTELRPPVSRARTTRLTEPRPGGAEPRIAEQSRSWRGRLVSGRLCAVLEAPTLVASLDDIAMVSEAIEHGGCHLGVAEHLRPIGESQIGGDQQRRVLVEFADQVE
jgi:hypothetical protein